MSKRGKQYLEVAGKVNKNEEYLLPEGIETLKKMKYTKFDGSLECHFRVRYKTSQNVRGGLVLPHGTGKKVSILVFAKGDKAEEAKSSGADYVGAEDMIQKIQDGWTDFNFAVATPDMMKEVGKLGPILGKKGLMPRPKSGTVTLEIGNAVKKLRSGWVEYKCDKGGVIHLGVGKLSFDTDKLVENTETVYHTIMKDKPSDAKGQYVISFYINGTMMPSVKIDLKGLKN